MECSIHSPELLVSLSVVKSHHYGAAVPHYAAAGAHYSDYTDAYYDGHYY